MASLLPLIETLRGDTLECVHHGAVAVADASGRVIAQVGDAHWLCFTRSTLKPFQALPFVEAGGPRHFGFGVPQLAMLCASHSGEAMHVDNVDTMLTAAGLQPRALQCGCHQPLYADLGLGPAPAAVDERHHNCSGKHAGFLAWCVQHGQPTANYLAPGHPLQLAIRRAVADVTGLDANTLAAGTDGCSAPNYALPLSRLAQAYARLASGADDARHGEAFAALGAAMVAHPDLVSGTARNDLAFMRAGRGDWISKAGADGVQCVASRGRRQAVAVKVADGSKLAVQAATVAVLDQLGWLDVRQRDELRPWRAESIANARGTRVGERRPAFKLERL